MTPLFDKFIRLCMESSVRLRGEYWITPDGLVYVDDESNHHEDRVMQVICMHVRDIAGMEQPDYDDDAVSCRTELSDHLDGMVGPDEDIDDVYDEIWTKMAKVLGKRQIAEEARILFGSSDQNTDAREFAIKWWNWIRVAGGEAEMRDFTPSTLQKAGEGFLDILGEENEWDDDNDFDNVPVTISIYGTRKRITTTVGDLVKGNVGDAEDANAETASAYARAAVAKMDQAAMPSYYRGQAGG